MKPILLLVLAAVLFCSCNSNGKGGKTFCDTACKSDRIEFKGDDQFKQLLALTINGCSADSLTWTDHAVGVTRAIQLSEFLNKPVRINKSALGVYFQDTTMAWVTFNDCLTGRGYLLKLPYRKSETIQKISSALTAFDPKFSVDEDLRAYTDEGNLYVDNVKTGKTASMTFREKFPMDFNNIHQVVDSIHVTKDRLWVRLMSENKEHVFEKKVEL